MRFVCLLMTVCYRRIDSTVDTSKLQNDIDQLGKCARKCGMKFQPVKCNIMQLTRKRIKTDQCSLLLRRNSPRKCG